MKSISYSVYKGTVILGEKWIKKMTGKPGFKEGALRKHFGLKEGEYISIKMINDELSKLKKKYPEGGYSGPDLKLVRQLNAAKNMMKVSSNVNKGSIIVVDEEAYFLGSPEACGKLFERRELTCEPRYSKSSKSLGWTIKGYGSPQSPQIDTLLKDDTHSEASAGLKDKEVDPHRIVLDTMSLEEAVKHDNPGLAKKNLDILDSELNQLIRDNYLTASMKCTSANSIHKIVKNAEGLENALKKGDKHQASEFAKALKNNFLYIRKYYIK